MNINVYPSQELLRAHFVYDVVRGGLMRKSRPRPIQAVSGSDLPRRVAKMPGERKNYYMNRLVYIWHHGDIPTDLVIDHVNGDTLDDRIENLRACTQAENLLYREYSHSEETKAKQSAAALERWKRRL